MKIDTSISVVIRIVLWLFMLVGGAVYAYKVDRDNSLFLSPLFHLLSALIGLFILRLVFRATANGGRELAKGRDKTMPRLETNRLVTTGIYSCMRHPMLFGLTLLPLGCIAFGYAYFYYYHCSFGDDFYCFHGSSL